MIDTNSSPSILDALREDNFTLGNCSVQIYDRKRVDIWGTNYLHHIYGECLRSRPTHPYGILPESFCGMTDLSADAICSYLHSRPVLLLLCVHTSAAEFTPVGFAYPTTFCGAPLNLSAPIPPATTVAERSMFAGYAFFRPWWGKPEIEVLGMLGLAYFFTRFSLIAVHGMRYPENGLTAHFMQRYGSREVGRIPYYMLNDGKLDSCVVSTLLRTDFEQYCRRAILSLAGETVTNGQGQHHRPSEPGSRTGDAAE